MKRIIQLAICCGVLMTQGVFAASYNYNQGTQGYQAASTQNWQTSAVAADAQATSNAPVSGEAPQGNWSGSNDRSYGNAPQGNWGGSYDRSSGYQGNMGGNGCCDPCPAPCAAPCDQPCGDEYKLYCHYEPCYRNCWRCVDCPQYCKKKCCRYVPKYYEVQRCRYVPQYYCETCCKYCPEYYCVDQCIPCKKWVCDKKCDYVPRYYYKHTCENPCAPTCQ